MAPQKISIGSASGAITWQTDEILQGLTNLEKQTLKALENKMISFAAATTRYARSNRRWQDRTHKAKDTLSTNKIVNNNFIGIVLSHGMYYGVYLEAKKEYEIIDTTLKAMAPRIMQGLNNMMGDLGKVV